MGQSKKSTPRTARTPGHAWQENELYDVFLPIIGPYAAMVWNTMTRLSYGADVEATLRELAARTVISKDTVARSIAVLGAVGMIEILGDSRYRLIDLKVLVVDLGGVFLRQKASYELPVAQSDRLRVEVRRVLAQAQRKPVAQSDKAADVQEIVPVSPERQACPARATNLSCQSDKAGRVIDIQDTRNQENPSPTPSRKREGGCKLHRPVCEVEQTILRVHVPRVMDECSFLDRRGRRGGVFDTVFGVFMAEIHGGRDPAALAMLLAARWKEFQKHLHLMRFQMGPRKFFAEGYWSNANAWPWDPKAVAIEQERRVGR
jgi:hypothetical protein